MPHHSLRQTAEKRRFHLVKKNFCYSVNVIRGRAKIHVKNTPVNAQFPAMAAFGAIAALAFANADSRRMRQPNACLRSAGKPKSLADPN